MEELKYEIYKLSFESFILGALFMIVIFYYGFRLSKNHKKNVSQHPDLYCFNCEIEMPVKEKNGRLHCSNCGLYHDAFQ